MDISLKDDVNMPPKFQLTYRDVTLQRVSYGSLT